jgi:predicted negative regulator of RcsB-dependent stress response
MNEESKGEDQKKPDFLSGHEELLNALNQKKQAQPEQEETEVPPVAMETAEKVASPETTHSPEQEAHPVEAAPSVTEEPEVEEATIPDPEPTDKPIEESEVAKEPIAEQEAVEEPIAEPEIAEEPVAEPEIAEEPIAEPEVAEEPVAEPEVAEEPVAEPEVVEAQETMEEKPIREPLSKESEKTKSPDRSSVQKSPAPVKKKKGHAEQPRRTQPEKQRHDELLKKQMLEQAEVKEVLHFIQKYLKPTAIAILAVCIVFLGVRLVQSNTLKQQAEADAALIQANSTEDFQAILENYGNTPSAPLALMSLAREQFNSGRIVEAEQHYVDFLKRFSKHDLADQAELNVIRCKEANGQYSEAIPLYREFAETHKNSHLVLMALFGKAQCLEKSNQLDEAKIAYEDIVVNHAGTMWAKMAESRLQAIK